MNLLTQGTNSLVKKLPIHRPRSAIVKNILYANTALFGFYMLSSGPGKLRYQRTFTAAPNSSIESLLYFHFAHTSVLQFLFTSGVFYTIGNYHVAAYGCSSFMHSVDLYSLQLALELAQQLKHRQELWPQLLV